MKYIVLSFPLALLLLSGCANREGVAPSKNPSLQAISPSTTATAEGGAMQRSLDAWLKEEWAPLTEPSVQTTKAADGTITQTKVEIIPAATATTDGKISTMSATQVTTTTVTTPDGKVTTSTTSVAEPIDDTPFTLQKYADKWKVYHENKEKMNVGKPKEPSHLEMMQSMPVIGK